MQSADRLKYERMQRGWSQARVAELIGTDAGNVSRWERGRSVPSPYFREQLCQLYEKTAQELGLWMEKPTERKRVEETSPLDCSDVRQVEAVPAVSCRVLASLSYVFGWVTGLLVLLFHRSNRFVLFHSLQSTCFFGGLHLVIVFCVLSAPLTEHNAFFTLARDLCGPFAALVGLIAWGVGVIQAARGKDTQLPLVGAWCKRLTRLLLRAHTEPTLDQLTHM